jgi:hypothetical protein
VSWCPVTTRQADFSSEWLVTRLAGYKLVYCAHAEKRLRAVLCYDQSMAFSSTAGRFHSALLLPSSANTSA